MGGSKEGLEREMVPVSHRPKLEHVVWPRDTGWLSSYSPFFYRPEEATETFLFEMHSKR
jgi:hypothetical protein